MLADLTAPIGELGDAAPEGLDGSSELLPLDLDVAPDLRRRSARDPARGAGNGLTGSGAIDAGLVAHGAPVRVSLVRRASSIASSGVGGAPACTER